MADLSKAMPEDTNYITISCVMNKITVRKKTLEELGDPKYISFMMRDDGRAAMIKATTQGDDEAIAVSSTIESKGMMLFGGKVLVGMIREKMGWDKKFAYRIPARKKEDNMFLFEFENAVPSTTTKNWEALLEIDREEEDTTYFWKDTGEELFKAGDADKGADQEEQKELQREDKVSEENSETASADETDMDAGSMSDCGLEMDTGYFAGNIDTMQWAFMQMQEWGWKKERMEYWSEEMSANTKEAAAQFIAWRNGNMSQENFLARHRELEQMDFAFEMGRRVSIIRRIRANLKAFSPTMMAIIYDERADTCEEILGILKRYPQMSDFDIAVRVGWEG